MAYGSPPMAPAQIFASRVEKSMPAAFAACGSRLVAVMPGSELTSRHQKPAFRIAAEIHPAVGAEFQRPMRRQRMLSAAAAASAGRNLRRKHLARSAHLVLGLVIEHFARRDDLAHRQGRAVEDADSELAARR